MARSDPRDDCGFLPDAARAARLDARVRAGLADSLHTIFASIDDLEADPDAVAGLIETVRAGAVGPGLFALYTYLVQALFAEDIARAQTLTDLLLSPTDWRASPLQPVTLDDRELGPGQAERYRRLIDDEDTGLILEPVAAPQRAQSEDRLRAALALLARGFPDLAAEVRSLVREVVLVDGRTSGGTATFAGASTFYLWGAIALNAPRHTDRLSLALTLVHESGHSLLFGMSLGAKLVENAESELYPSPLRADPRPMDGVVHATYILARMVCCLRTLADSGALDAVETAWARNLLDCYHQSYRRGLDTVLAHARLTPIGATAFRQAQDHMAAA